MLIQGSDLLFQKVNYLEAALLTGSQKTDDTYALNLLQPLLNGYPFIPLQDHHYVRFAFCIC
jgi:hypothetical protein